MRCPQCGRSPFHKPASEIFLPIEGRLCDLLNAMAPMDYRDRAGKCRGSLPQVTIAAAH